MTKEIRAMKALDKEIEEMEAMISAPQNEEPAEVVEQPTVPEMVAEPTEKVIAETTPDLQKEHEQLQKRFNKYKGSSDQTIFSLRSEVKDLKSTIVSLQTELAKLKSKPKPVEDKSITSYLSKEDQEVLGDTAVEALDRSIKEMVNAQVNPLKSQLDNEAKYRAELEQRNREQIAVQRQQQFLSQLAQIVPDYNKIVEIDDFRNRYLKEPDEFSGIQREKLFVAAEEDGDVGRVASFFNDYKNFLRSKDDVFESHVTPTGVKGDISVAEGKPKYNITPKFIEKFYDDVAKGAKEYRGESGRAKAAEIEAAIDNFIMNGGHHSF